MAFFTRTPNLKVYSDYRKYRPQLASDFNHLCAYCEMSETYLRTQSAFGVDHFRPFALFPELDCVYTNLYYCCNDCNAARGESGLRLKASPAERDSRILASKIPISPISKRFRTDRWKLALRLARSQSER